MTGFIPGNYINTCTCLYSVFSQWSVDKGITAMNGDEMVISPTDNESFVRNKKKEMSKEKQNYSRIWLECNLRLFFKCWKTGTRKSGNNTQSIKFLLTALLKSPKSLILVAVQAVKPWCWHKNIPSEIIGVDLWSGFINQFNQNAQNKSLHGRMKGIVGNMENLPFQEEDLDLIWSEGAIYNIDSSVD